MGLHTVWVSALVLGTVQVCTIAGLPIHDGLELYGETNPEKPESSELPIPVLYQESNPTNQDSSELPIPVLYQQSNPTNQDSSELPIPVLYQESNPTNQDSSELPIPMLINEPSDPAIPELYEESTPVTPDTNEKAAVEESNAKSANGTTKKPITVDELFDEDGSGIVEEDTLGTDDNDGSGTVEEDILGTDETEVNQDVTAEKVLMYRDDDLESQADHIDVVAEVLQEADAGKSDDDGEDLTTTETIEDVGESLQEYLTAKLSGDSGTAEKQVSGDIPVDDQTPETDAEGDSILQYILSKLAIGGQRVHDTSVLNQTVDGVILPITDESENLEVPIEEDQSEEQEEEEDGGSFLKYLLSKLTGNGETLYDLARNRSDDGFHDEGSGDDVETSADISGTLLDNQDSEDDFELGSGGQEIDPDREEVTAMPGESDDDKDEDIAFEDKDRFVLPGVKLTDIEESGIAVEVAEKVGLSAGSHLVAGILTWIEIMVVSVAAFV